MAVLKRKQTDGDDAEGSQADTQAGKQVDKKQADKKQERGERAAARPKGERTAKVRSRVAQVVWLLFVVAALFLAVGALCIALGANKDNGLVSFVLSGAHRLDLGVFSLKNGIKHFGGADAQVKNALLNWGIGAVAYLVVGRIVERIIRP